MSTLNRDVWKDVARITAALAVVFLHSAAFIVSDENANASNWLIANIFSTVTRFCVPVFVMISGSIFLDPEKQKYNRLPTKNIVRIAVAFVFWSVVYQAFRILVLGKSIYGIGDAIAYFLKGYHHLWYMWMIAALYAAVPLFRKITSDKRATEYFLVFSFFGFILLRFITKIPYFYLDLLSAPFENMNLSLGVGYSFYFVAGYYFAHYEIASSKRKLVYLSAAFAVLLSYFGSYYLKLSSGAYNELFHEHLSPFSAVLALAVYIFMHHTLGRKSFSPKSEKTVVFFSKLTFGVYLSHILFTETIEHFGLFSSLPVFLSVTLEAVISIIASFILSFLLSKIPYLGKKIV